MYRAFRCLAFFVSSLYIASGAFAVESHVTLDMRNVIGLPKNFRTTSHPVESGINTKGLRELKAIGSGQFSVLSFKHVLDRIPSRKITIIDLRQEAHGFVNSNAVSWYAKNNAANANKRGQDIEIEQSFLLQSLLDQETIQLPVPGQKNKKVEFLIHRVASEADVVTQLGMSYERLYIQDHHAPEPKQVDRFVQIVKQLPKEQWLYFHCRAGRGRTSTFMLMYDIMRNADNISLKDLLKRQAAIGGKDLLQLPKRGTAKYQSAVERIHFIKQFYRYVKENGNGYQLSWSEWLGQYGLIKGNFDEIVKAKSRLKYCKKNDDRIKA